MSHEVTRRILWQGRYARIVLAPLADDDTRTRTVIEATNREDAMGVPIWEDTAHVNPHDDPARISALKYTALREMAAALIGRAT